MAHVPEQLTLPALDSVARKMMHDVHQHVNVGLVPWLAHIGPVDRIYTGVVCKFCWEGCARVEVMRILPRHATAFAVHARSRTDRAHREHMSVMILCSVTLLVAENSV